jgi:hypothetical protein
LSGTLSGLHPACASFPWHTSALGEVSDSASAGALRSGLDLPGRAPSCRAPFGLLVTSGQSGHSDLSCLTPTAVDEPRAGHGCTALPGSSSDLSASLLSSPGTPPRIASKVLVLSRGIVEQCSRAGSCQQLKGGSHVNAGWILTHFERERRRKSDPPSSHPNRSFGFAAIPARRLSLGR